VCLSLRLSKRETELTLVNGRFTEVLSIGLGVSTKGVRGLAETVTRPPMHLPGLLPQQKHHPSLACHHCAHYCSISGIIDPGLAHYQLAACEVQGCLFNLEASQDGEPLYLKSDQSHGTSILVRFLPTSLHRHFYSPRSGSVLSSTAFARTPLHICLVLPRARGCRLVFQRFR
jgi:hypothetical protein